MPKPQDVARDSDAPAASQDHAAADAPASAAASAASAAATAATAAAPTATAVGPAPSPGLTAPAAAAPERATPTAAAQQPQHDARRRPPSRPSTASTPAALAPPPPALPASPPPPPPARAQGLARRRSTQLSQAPAPAAAAAASAPIANPAWDPQSPASRPLASPPAQLLPPAAAHSPTSSSVSLSHGNLLETASITSSAAVTEDDLHLSSTSLSQSVTEPPLPTTRRPSRTQKIFTSLTRMQSIRTAEAMSSPSSASTPTQKKSQSHRYLSPATRGRLPFADDLSHASSDRDALSLSTTVEPAPGPKTAPLEPDRGFRQAMGTPELRNRSADRHHPSSRDDPRRPPTAAKPSASREGLFSNMLESGTKAAGGIGRFGNRFVGKFTRSGSTEKPVFPVKRELEVIRMKLVDQARVTRLAKRYSDARDKTQYWLPSLPYRCIDYLNLYGIDEVGIYRQSGSKIEIDRYLLKFDSGPTYDVNLLEDPDLNDVHIVSSVFKDWLRELPEPLIPEAAQSRMTEHIKDRETVPQPVKDELSFLPPHNYYLLFAITCHLSLLHNNCKVNRMTLENLATCFMHSLHVSQPIFALLILKWRDCWQGCRTESTYLAQERSYEVAKHYDQYYPENAIDDGSEISKTEDDRRTAVSSRGRGASGKQQVPPSSSRSEQGRSKKTKPSQSLSQELPLRQASSSKPPVLDPVTQLAPMQL